MRILAIDYGDARIGLAMSDLTKTIATPLPTIKNKGNVALDILRIVEANEVDTIVLGLPINMDGTEGERAELTREFAERIKQVCPSIVVDFIDERLTSKAAERILIEVNVRREKRNAMIDGMAARLILQAYLDKTSLR